MVEKNYRFFDGCTSWSSYGHAPKIGTLRGFPVVNGFYWDANLIWFLSWFTSWSLSWNTSLTGTLGGTAGGFDFLNISARVLNSSLCPFPSLTIGLAGDG